MFNVHVLVAADFLYMRKSEIIEHPYFSKFSNFTQDLDRFYKDMTGNDTITSVYKYAKVMYNFLSEKYFKLVPFGKELQDVASEILNELNELRNLPSARYLTSKYHQFYDKLVWVYDYFDMESRLHRFISLVHRKLTDLSQTALQAENRLVDKRGLRRETDVYLQILTEAMPGSHSIGMADFIMFSFEQVTLRRHSPLEKD